ncbi:MAG: monovalent cation/H+ antiporter subunit D [Sphingomonas sp.]|uniref:monovalent cation/H+ antiporter subunit D n=1 Tax=Sphingomonas sp. TaxID=28214 RepID=UPI0025FF54B7|nr:monovalent cation/H+ antiporter subunit D [Sphingomonas sp.]MBX3564402.1 monovalent cation/H+ antiporter subunit D [Sphingomonas sp.]
MTGPGLLVLPVLIPAIVAPLTLLFYRRRHRLSMAISVAGAAAMLAAAVALLVQAQDDAIRSYAMGGWIAPFGIVLVGDRLAAIMLVCAALLACIVLAHALLTKLDRKGWHFHPLFHFQLMGLNGAFLTGDLFNLFVFFEVLLIASYGLMLHGQGPARLKAGVAYVVVNIVGSSLFLIALAMLYTLTGTLNMADMAVRAAQVPAADGGLLRAAGLMLVTVFLLKAAVVPLHLWLPRTYIATAPAVAALFAIMTKVGVYALIRVVPLVFGAEAGAAAWVPAPWLTPAAILTAAIGFVGVLAAKSIREQAAFAVVGSTGTLLLAVGAWQREAMAAALFYMVHAIFAGAALFLVADVLRRRRGEYADLAVPSPRFMGQEAVAALFMLTAIAAVGLPPLSGFVGKLFILQTTGEAARGVIWTVILITTFIGVVGFARTGSLVFWKPAPTDAPFHPLERDHGGLIAPAATIVVLAALTLAAGWGTRQTEAAAAQIFAPDRYVAAVLGGDR